MRPETATLSASAGSAQRPSIIFRLSLHRLTQYDDDHTEFQINDDCQNFLQINQLNRLGALD
ncbi:hypothetical protein J6590_073955 [Homalodisca vitripennis]|nr:hypothetical protein J6590_073955 [Homalodisca vitripennis]